MPYHRIIHPINGNLNAANFPNLVVASVKYMKKFGLETFKFMATTIVTISGLVNKVITKNDRDIYIYIHDEPF